MYVFGLILERIENAKKDPEGPSQTLFETAPSLAYWIRTAPTIELREHTPKIAQWLLHDFFSITGNEGARIAESSWILGQPLVVDRIRLARSEELLVRPLLARAIEIGETAEARFYASILGEVVEQMSVQKLLTEKARRSGGWSSQDLELLRQLPRAEQDEVLQLAIARAVSNVHWYNIRDLIGVWHPEIKQAGFDVIEQEVVSYLISKYFNDRT